MPRTSSGLPWRPCSARSRWHSAATAPPRNIGEPLKIFTARRFSSGRSWTRSCSWRVRKPRPDNPTSGRSSWHPGSTTTSAAGPATIAPSTCTRTPDRAQRSGSEPIRPCSANCSITCWTTRSSTAPGSPVHVRIGAKAIEPRCPFRIEGDGLPAKELPHIFEPFYRTAEARRRGRSGVGLGLSVVRRIADVLGGTIGVSTQPGRGSRFVLSLPIATDARPTPPPSPCSEALSTTRA